MDQKIKENLNNLSVIFDCSPDRIIEIALSQYLHPFLNSFDNLPVINAIYRENDKKYVCHFIEQISFHNKLYSKIILNNKIKFVPSEYIDYVS